ncbi:MAG: hypothetical protein NTW17_00570 [Candidatus Pacearchaeota archaeon]|nr:hypothetical protein [Candidatus Pacearchaeota archaeon]
MKKGLIQRIKNSIKDSTAYQELARAGRVLRHSPRHLYSTLALSSLLAGLVACGDGPMKPEINYSPQSVVDASPREGISQVISRVTSSCTDPDGESDIAEAYAVIGNDTVRTKSLDSAVTFTQPAAVSSYCRDFSGHVSRAGPINVNVLQPSFSQTATRVNDIDINYTATLENVVSATRKTLYNGNLTNTRTITGPTYSESIPQNQKGQTCFVLEANGVAPDTACIDVPNFKPTADLSGVQINLNEGDSASAVLPRPRENNTEDNPVPYIFARSSDGKTQVGIVNDILKIKALGESTGAYRIVVGFGTPEGGIDSSAVQGNIIDLPTISGRLENSETNSGIPGTVMFYNGNDTLFTRSSDSQGHNLTNPDGSFRFTITTPASQLEDILAQARPGTPGGYSGWVRTITLPGKDASNVLMSAVPYGRYASNPESFVQFIRELATDAPNTRFDFNGEYIPGFRGLQGIEILSQNPFGASYGTFTPEQQGIIKNKILDPNDINALVQNRIHSEDILIGNFGHYSLDSANQRIVPDEGWIIVAPNSNLSSSGLTEPYRVGTLVHKGTIYLNPFRSGGGTRSHEFGHMIIGTGHPDSMAVGETVMANPIMITTTGPADKKAGAIIYQPSFMVFSSQEYPSVDNIGNILGANFK